jgi:hypothetical protein
MGQGLFCVLGGYTLLPEQYLLNVSGYGKARIKCG